MGDFMTIWQHTYTIIATPEATQSALVALDLVMPDEGGPRSFPFGRALSSGGNLPASHYLISFQCTEEQRQQFIEVGLGDSVGLTYWRTSNPGGVLVTTNHQGSVELIGSQFSWVDALTQADLQFIIPQVDI